MIYISFDVDHYYTDGVDCDKRNIVEFDSLDDALTWASFYHDKYVEHDNGYSRSWFIRGIYSGRTYLHLTPMDYIHSDLTWSEIDELPLHTG